MTAVEIIRKVISSYKNTGISSDVMVNELLKLVDDSILEMEKKQQSYSEEDLKEAFIEGYKQRAEKSDLIFDNASKMYAIHLFENFKNK
mgnify:CR=1 FL=1|jgi:hypothetical protein